VKNSSIFQGIEHQNMHAHNTRLNAAITDLLIERQQKKYIKTPEAMAALQDIQVDLFAIERLIDRKEKMVIATRIFKKVMESAPHLMWQHPRFKTVVQNKVNQFMEEHRNNVYKDIDEQTRKEFTAALFKMQSMC
jgi:hypothetical protein